MEFGILEAPWGNVFLPVLFGSVALLVHARGPQRVVIRMRRVCKKRRGEARQLKEEVKRQ